MSIVACPSCGETYVSSAQVCADCGLPLVDLDDAVPAPHLAPGGVDEVGYDLEDWEPPQRGELVRVLTGASIAHRWEDGELVVRERDADAVEEMIDAIDSPDALDVEEEDDDDEAAAELLSTLYVSADVLMGDHENPGAVLDLVAAEEEAREVDSPYGVAPATWEEIRKRAAALCSLLDDGADAQDVRASAKLLRDLLHPLV